LLTHFVQIGGFWCIRRLPRAAAIVAAVHARQIRAKKQRRKGRLAVPLGVREVCP
jgi:hypothetical protein